MPDRRIEFVLKRPTKRTFLFEQTNGEEVKTIYVAQSVFDGKAPEKLAITLHIPD